MVIEHTQVFGWLSGASMFYFLKTDQPGSGRGGPRENENGKNEKMKYFAKKNEIFLIKNEK